MDIRDIEWGTISQIDTTFGKLFIGQLGGVKMNYFVKELSVEELYQITDFIKRK